MVSLFQRLKERKLVQWTLAYVAAAWALLQVVNLVGEQFAWPGVLLRSITVLLAFGFVAALIVAWYHGEKRQQRVTGMELLMLSALLLVAASALAAVRDDRIPATATSASSSENTPAPMVQQGSIAVLPFVNMSSDSEQEYFSDGITEDILTNLSRIGGLRVIARTSVMGYKGTTKKVREVGRELGVAHVLEGSVRRAGNRVKITAQLIDARTDNHLWADDYDIELTADNVFQIQADIARQIASALQMRLSAEDHGRIAQGGTRNLAAYDLYLHGRYFWNQRTEEGLAESIRFFESALAQDSSYALAFSGLADAYTVLGANGHRRPSEVIPKAEAAAAMSLRLDSTLAQPHAARGVILSQLRRRWQDAEAEFERAVRLNPGYATGHHWHAWNLVALGRTDQALAAMRRAQRLDPLSLVINLEVGNMLFYARRYPEAEQAYKYALKMDPHFHMAHASLAELYLETGAHPQALAALDRSQNRAGRYGTLPIRARVLARTQRHDEARQIVRELLAHSEREYVPPISIAAIYIDLGEMDLAFEWLYKALEIGDSQFVELRSAPKFDPIRSDPRFPALLRAAGL
ncbi:MAG: tetratricopeptide repeat protein [Gemmatimonadetes bacterium]|nr:tetratricopeptide repeat protein [Gemmatimonadota bacterium]